MLVIHIQNRKRLVKGDCFLVGEEAGARRTKIFFLQTPEFLILCLLLFLVASEAILRPFLFSVLCYLSLYGWFFYLSILITAVLNHSEQVSLGERDVSRERHMYILMLIWVKTSLEEAWSFIKLTWELLATVTVPFYQAWHAALSAARATEHLLSANVISRSLKSLHNNMTFHPILNFHKWWYKWTTTHNVLMW